MAKWDSLPSNKGLPRWHILRGRKAMIELFENGNSLVLPPLRLMYLWKENSDGAPVLVMFSVSKRHVKKAVRRNRIKRLLREGWRKNCFPLWELAVQSKQNLHVAIIYTRQHLPEYPLIEHKIIEAIRRLKTSNETPD